MESLQQRRAKHRNLFSCLVLLVLTISEVANGQFMHAHHVAQGGINTATGAVIENVDLGNISSNGVIACHGDDDRATLDDFIFVNGDFPINSGTVAGGTGGGILDNISTLTGYRHVNSAGDVVYVTTGLDGVSAAMDTAVMLNLTSLMQEGEPAVGIAGRTYSIFFDPSLSDSGLIYVEVDLDGSTSDDEVYYTIDTSAGNAVSVFMLTASTQYREGQAIIGGPLNGELMGTTVNATANNLGTFLAELDVPATANNEVIVRKKLGMPYEVLLREMATQLVTPLSGLAPVKSFTGCSLAIDSDHTVVYGFMDAVSTTANNDSVVIADVGAGPVVVAQEGQDVSALLGAPGVKFGTMTAATVNASGKVWFLSTLVPAPPNADEAIFQWQAGVLSLVITDEVPVLTLPGSIATDILSASLTVNGQDRLIYECEITLPGSTTTSDAIVEAVIPAVLPVTGFACSTPNQFSVLATWAIPAGQTYDAISVRENGGLPTLLAGTATSYASSPATTQGTIGIEVTGLEGGNASFPVQCSQFVVAQPTIQALRAPAAPILNLMNTADVNPVTASFAIQELMVNLQITHGSQTELDIDLVSPQGTQVFLATDIGGTADDANITFADFAPVVTNLATGGYAAPEGPGSLSDYECELSNGDWTLNVFDDTLGFNEGVLDSWTLNFYQNPAPGLDCCPRPGMLACANSGVCGPGGGGADLSWTNNSPSGYSLLQLTRTQGAASIMIPLSPTATSYTDPAATNGLTYTYTLQYQCMTGGAIQDASSCTVFINSSVVPAPTGLTCTPDPCGTNNVVINWLSAANYSSLVLNRGGMFLANVTGLNTYTDTAPVAGTYSLVATCATQTAQVNCSVSLNPPFVTSFVGTSNFCAGTVQLTWNTNGVPYNSLVLNRGGNFLATVTGQTSYTDTTNPGGATSYSIVATCGPGSATTNLSVSHTLAVPTGLSCVPDQLSGTITLNWTNNTTYDSMTLLRNGVAVTPGPALGATSFVDLVQTTGSYTYELEVSCAAQPPATSAGCTAGLLFSGGSFLLIASDIPDSAAIHDPSNGGHILTLWEEAVGTDVNLAQNMIVGPSFLPPPAPADLMYVADTVDGAVTMMRYRLDGTNTIFDELFTNAELDNPCGMAFRNNLLYIASGDTDRISVWDPISDTLTPFIQMAAGNADPQDLLFIEPAGDLLVSMWDTDSIVLFPAGGGAGQTIISPASMFNGAPLAIDAPNQITRTATGSYVVGCSVSDNIIVFDLAGTVTQVFAAGIAVLGVHELPNGDILWASNDATGNGVYALNPTVGTSTLVFQDGGRDFFWIQEVGAVSGAQQFVRGNCNADTAVNLSDAVFLLGYLFPVDLNGDGVLDTSFLTCADACDANDDGALNLSDVIALLGSIFGAPTILDLPFPNANDGCGQDPTTGPVFEPPVTSAGGGQEWLNGLDCAVNTPPC